MQIIVSCTKTKYCSDFNFLALIGNYLQSYHYQRGSRRSCRTTAAQPSQPARISREYASAFNQHPDDNRQVSRQGCLTNEVSCARRGAFSEGRLGEGEQTNIFRNPLIRTVFVIYRCFNTVDGAPAVDYLLCICISSDCNTINGPIFS